MRHGTGNIVAEYKYGNINIEISDAAYAGRTEEELENVRKASRTIARRLEKKADLRKLGWENVNPPEGRSHG